MHRDFVQGFTNNFLGALTAFSALGVDAQPLADFAHRARAGADGLADLSIGNGMADADIHDAWVTLWYVPRGLA